MKMPLPLVKYMNANTKKHKNNIACSQRYVPRDGSNTKMKPAMHEMLLSRIQNKNQNRKLRVKIAKHKASFFCDFELNATINS